MFLKVPETVCSLVEIPVPSQAKLHKQWCLFDQVLFLSSKIQTISSSAQQEGNIDFDREVRKITGSVEQALKDEDEIIDTVQQRHSLSFLQFPFLH